MVGFAESVTVFDADNRSRELPLHPDGKFYDASDNQENLGNESMHLSETGEDPSFMDAYSDMPMGDGFDSMMSFSALNKSAGDLWDGSFGSFASEGSASIAQFQDARSGSAGSGLKEVPMDASMSILELPRLIDASNASGSERSLTSSLNKGEEEPEKDVNREVVKQMGQTMMLQGGLYFAMGPIMRLGKRLFRKGGDEEDLVEDAGTTHVMMSRSGQIQHGMLNRGGDISNFAQVGAHESSRNMAGAFVVQQDVTAQVMKQAMIQAAQSAGASVGQGAATMTLAATAGAAAGGATAVVAGGAAAATMSVKFAMGVAIGSVIAAGSLGGATLGSYMVDEELKSNVPRPILANNDLAPYKFDVVELAEGISPTLSPASFYEELASLGIVPTASPGDDLDYDVDPDRPLTLSPIPDFTTSSPAAAVIVGLPTRAPTAGSTGIPTNVLTGSPGSWTGATDNPVLSPASESSNTDSPTIATTSPVAITTGDLTGGFVFSPTMETSDLTISPMIDPTSDPAGDSFVADPTETPSSSTTTPDSPTAAVESPTTSPGIDLTASPTSAPFATATGSPIRSPTIDPTTNPTSSTVASPTVSPVASPTVGPTSSPTSSPVASPATATSGPTASPTSGPTSSPTSSPIASPTGSPIATPTSGPTFNPTSSPSASPTFGPTPNPSSSPSASPTAGPSSNPSSSPSASPTTETGSPSAVSSPSLSPATSDSPVVVPVNVPSAQPSAGPTMYVPTGTITGWSLVSGSGTVLIASLSQWQTISTTTYGTNLKVRALYSTVTGAVGSVSFAITNNNGGGSSNIWDRAAPFETDNSFLNFASVKIRATPLPSSTNQGIKGVTVELNLLIVN